jgi:hypothetical protein
MENETGVDSMAESIINRKGAVFLIGAGASECLGYPSSEALSEKIADSFNHNSRHEGPQVVVKGILKKIGRQKLVDWIRLEFKSIAEKEDQDIFNNPYHYLAVISKEILEKNNKEGRTISLYFFTTNFDGELVKGFEKELVRDKEFEVFASNQDFTKRKNAPVHIYLLHGDIDVKTNGDDTLVLTDDDLTQRKEYNDAMYVDLEYALQHFPLWIIGHSMRDADIKEIYDTVRNRIKDTVTFEVNPAGSSLKDTTPIKTELPPFLYALASSMNKIYGMNTPLLHQPIVELLYYNDFIKKVEDSAGKNKSILIYGHHFSGKSTFVNYLYAKGKIPRGYRRLILSTFSGSDTGRKEVTEIIKASSIAEATHYEREWFLGNDESVNKLSFLRSIANHFGRRMTEVPEDDSITHLEIKIYYEDAERLLDHYAKLYKADENLFKDTKKRNKLISLGSYGGSPPKSDGERGGVLIPPLLEKVVKDYKDRRAEELDRLEQEQRDREKLTEEFLGFSILEALGIGTDVYSEFLRNITSTSLPLLAAIPEVSLAGLVILGVSGITSFYKGQRNGGLIRYTNLFKYWNELPMEKRVMIAEELDRKSKIPPGSSYSFLSHWFSKGEGRLDEESEKFRRKMEAVFTDDFIRRTREVIEQFPHIIDQISEDEERITDLERRVENIETVIEGGGFNDLKWPIIVNALILGYAFPLQAKVPDVLSNLGINESKYYVAMESREPQPVIDSLKLRHGERVSEAFLLGHQLCFLSNVPLGVLKIDKEVVELMSSRLKLINVKNEIILATNKMLLRMMKNDPKDKKSHLNLFFISLFEYLTGLSSKREKNEKFLISAPDMQILELPDERLHGKKDELLMKLLEAIRRYEADPDVDLLYSVLMNDAEGKESALKRGGDLFTTDIKIVKKYSDILMKVCPEDLKEFNEISERIN